MLQNENAMPELLQIVLRELGNFTSFIIFMLFYFGFGDDKRDLRVSTILKCAPIVSLGVYVIAKGFNSTIEYNYSQMVLTGLFFSCIGDGFLNYDHFPQGMAIFGIAQLFYITAFELEPWKFKIGMPLYAIATGMILFIFNSLSFEIKIGLPIYAFLLTTMCWRAIVRATERTNVFTIIGAVGSVLFVISDTLISVDMFVQPVPYAWVFVMLTYYLAQFCISLSTLSDVYKTKKTKGSKKLSRKYRDQDLK